MSEGTIPIDFERGTSASASACNACGQPIASAYFTIGSQIACERCKSQVEAELKRPAGVGGLARSLMLGSAAGAVGAAAWWGIRTATGYELGLIAVAIGYFVGRAVRSGSRGLGGVGFQILAVALTYFWISANYVPDVLASMEAEIRADERAKQERGESPGSERRASAAHSPFALKLVGAALLALALPFMMGMENAIGILIIGFGLYQAWIANRRVQVAVAGPFSLAPAAPAGG